MKQRFGLLGRTLGHSFSPQIHACFGDYRYDLFPVEPDALKDFLLHAPFDGLNVTIPYKQAVMPYCSYIDPLAARIGAVNTLIRMEDGLHGYNTDYFGFLSMTQRAGVSFAGKRVLILGSGGTSRTVTAVLEDQGAERICTASRNGSLRYDDLSECYDFDAIINTTPVGMYPNNGARIVDIAPFRRLSAVFDVIYNPYRTDLVQQAAARSITVSSGLPMLVLQAAAASALFTGKPVPTETSEQNIDLLQCQTRNIVLIGMPGCGKTTIGKLLSHAHERPFLDTDVAIEKDAGRSIPVIFQAEGEAAFRRMENDAIRKLCKQSGCVIATGGGAVLDADNREAIRENAFVVFVQRPLAALSMDGRPLSTGADALAAMYATRLPLYEACADFTVSNTGAPEDAAAAIWDAFRA
ncbi:MAG: shikimate kinase [Clostridia bacterium]|nr:shikimate kinase [Clostridia bacterium]